MSPTGEHYELRASLGGRRPKDVEKEIAVSVRASRILASRLNHLVDPPGPLAFTAVGPQPVDSFGVPVFAAYAVAWARTRRM